MTSFRQIYAYQRARPKPALWPTVCASVSAFAKNSFAKQSHLTRGCQAGCVATTHPAVLCKRSRRLNALGASTHITGSTPANRLPPLVQRDVQMRVDEVG